MASSFTLGDCTSKPCNGLIPFLLSGEPEGLGWAVLKWVKLPAKLVLCLL